MHGTQLSLKRYDRNITSDLTTRDPLPGVSIRIANGRARNMVREVRNTAYFIGTDRGCDMVLGDSRFPDLYAFLLVCQHGVIVRHLGGGPDLQVDGRTVKRAVVTEQSVITAGPFQLIIRVDPSNQPTARRLRVHDVGAEREVHRTAALIQQASRLLAKIDDQQNSLSTLRPIPILPNHTTNTQVPIDVSVGLPTAQFHLPSWHHIST